MNIVLLSGGSGKRLWPLSNEVRSKQFLRLLEAPGGKNESMIQRVFRQINETVKSENVVVATGEAQKDLILRHIGKGADIVTEPERRNTFPAVALSCAYLKYEKHCADDEVVTVIPVDPYTESGYFETLSRMEKAVCENVGDLVLMGIKPTYNSAKYGYMIPEKNNGEPFKVLSFKEKPTEEEAAKLIEKGAMWNGGVFAFRLGWLMNIVHKQADFSGFNELREKYNELHRTSFDYEICEKAEKIAACVYSGEWKDLGTWNTMTEKMSASSIGPVITGEGTENTHIINELEIPIVVLGINNAVVTAAPDGILVSDMHKSSYIKPYVENISDKPMYEECSWGEYKIIDYSAYDDGRVSLTKKLNVKKGRYTSYHQHKFRDEIWTFLGGKGEMLMDGRLRSVKQGDMIYVTSGTHHALHAIDNLTVLEVQIGTKLSEDDKEYLNAEW